MDMHDEAKKLDKKLAQIDTAASMDRFLDEKYPTSEPVNHIEIMSHESIGREFAKRYAGEVIYRGTKHKCWFVWSGKRWLEDSSKQRHRLLAPILADNLERYTNESTYKMCRRRLCDMAFVRGALEVSSRQLSMVDAKDDLFDRQRDLLNTPGGTVNLRTGTLQPHESAQLLTRMTAATPDPDMKTPVWNTFIDTILGDDDELKECLLRWLGYCLTGEVSEQEFLIALGPPSTGKSTLFSCFCNLLGDYAETLDAKALMSTKGMVQHSTDIAKLEGMRFVKSSEIAERETFNDPLIKGLVGDDRVSARLMRQDARSFDVTFKLNLLANDEPGFKGGDGAMERRIRVIPFNRVVPESERDTALPAKLQKEWPGILHLLIGYAQKWYAFYDDDGGKGALGESAAMKELKRSYMTRQDVVRTFMEENVERGGDFGKIKATELFESLQNESPEKRITWRMFLTRIDRLGYKTERTQEPQVDGKRQWVWRILDARMLDTKGYEEIKYGGE